MYHKFPTPMPIDLDVRPDWMVFAFTFALAVVAGVGFVLFREPPNRVLTGKTAGLGHNLGTQNQLK